MNLLKKGIYFLFAATVIVACSDDDDGPSGPIDGGGDSNHPLAGTSWSIADQDAAIGVGPSVGDTSWWYFNQHGDDSTARACLLDDVFTFNADGTYAIDLGSQTWIEPWQNQDIDGDGTPGVAPSADNGWSADEGCWEPVAPHTSKTDHSWTADSSTLTVTGSGAFIGLAKVHNTAEDGKPADDTITYNYTLDGDTLEITISGFQGGSETWHYTLTKQ